MSCKSSLTKKGLKTAFSGVVRTCLGNKKAPTAW
nr:MAG TPA: hypothetical protein [Caudoviricetes sp.]